MRYRVIYFQCLCYLALPLCIVSMHLTRCALWYVVCLFSFVFFNFLVLKLQFMRIKMYISASSANISSSIKHEIHNVTQRRQLEEEEDRTASTGSMFRKTGKVSSSFHLLHNTTVRTSTSIQLRRAGQQGLTRKLTAALERSLKQLLDTYSSSWHWLFITILLQTSNK